MTLFQIATILITLAAISSFVNFKFIKLPTTIGVMALSLCGSLALILLGTLTPEIHAQAMRAVGAIDFHAAVLDGMLAFLLFAGSIHLDLNDLRREQGTITLLALGGTLLSTAIVAALMWLVFFALRLSIHPIYCMLFGALISPTDPIAVLGILKTANAPKPLETQLAGESLFNDGVGVVIFLTLLGIAQGQTPTPWGLTLLLLREIVGGIAIGLAAGIAIYHLIKHVDHYPVEVLLTIALAMGTYELANQLHVSGPIAVVVAGLFVGNRGRAFGMSEKSREHIDMFWGMIDDILNAVLFLMIGLEILVTPFTLRILVAGLAAVGITLLARYTSVALSINTAGVRRRFLLGTITVLTWGGLRGGLSVAMALALPPGREQRIIVAVTYAVVVFSVFAQGLSIGAVVRRAVRRNAEPLVVSKAA